MTAFERETLRYLGNATADERLMALIASVEAALRIVDILRDEGFAFVTADELVLP